MVTKWTKYKTVLYSHSTPLSREVYLEKYGPHNFKQAFEIYEASFKWTPPDARELHYSMDYRYLAILTERLMRYEDNFHKFMKLSPKQQSNIQIHLHDKFSPRGLNLFLEALNLANNPEPVFVRLDLSNVIEFEESCRKVGLELKETSRNFQFRTLDYAEAQLKGWSLLTVLYLLRAVYGEDMVLDILSRMDEEGIDWGKTDIVEIAKNWKDWKDYPMTWTIETMDSPLTDDSLFNESKERMS